jgi:hypothetical protein
MTMFCKGQGGWNIGYLKVDSISKDHIGKRVRIDFKSSYAWTSPDRLRHIRSYVGTKDTGSITIDTTLLIIVERRKIYVDYGDYNDQYLECINCKHESVFIYDAIILDFDDQAIKFQFDIETKRIDQTVTKDTKTVFIDRKQLDGVMYML